MTEHVSRSEKKRQAQALQKAGKMLVDLSRGQLDVLDIPRELKEAVAMAWTLNRRQEAFRRQLQYIGRLMRHQDLARIETALQSLQSSKSGEKRRFALVERLRDQLVDGHRDAVDWILQHAADADKETLERLIAGARGTHAPRQRKAFSRKLFRYINGLDIKIEPV